MAREDPALLTKALEALLVEKGLITSERIDEIDIAERMLRPSYTPPWNLAGVPALAIPCGLSTGGLPISLQIVGKPFDEGTVLRVGDAYQRRTDWHLRVPAIASEVRSR